MERITYSILCIVTALISLDPASAETPSDMPWHQGVSPEDQQAARQLLGEAAELKSQLLLTEALAKYQQALSHWKHPELQFELATVLMKSAQPLRAYQYLRAALDWGDDALPDADRARAAEMETTLMTKHLATLAVTCSEPDAEVKLDGKPLVIGPGAKLSVVRPGEHVITASKPGYFAVVKPVTVVAGNRGIVAIKMNEDRVYNVRRWKAWKPWAVVSAGVATSLIGTGLLIQSSRDFDQADRDFQAMCELGATCAPDSPSSYNRAIWERRFATGAFIVGGLTVTTGLAMVFFNRAEAQRTQKRDESTFKLNASVSPDGAGLTARFRF